jgi:flavin reductase (DIM6/NTAB) family NADH-FMN oxidoreductase RutF
MQIDTSTTDPRETYKHMIACILPRPIAWVSTLSPKGVANLAPFSFFNGVCGNPPTVVFSVANKRDGSKKDTLINVEATKEFVVNIVPFALAEPMNASSAEYDYEQNEFEKVGIESLPSTKVKPPRVKDSPVQLECELTQVVSIGTGPMAGNLVIGRIVWMNISDAVLNEKKEIDPRKLDAIGRMGGIGYARTTDLFEIARPKVK